MIPNYMRKNKTRNGTFLDHSKRGVFLNKSGQIWETLIPWVIGIGVLILALLLFLMLSGKGIGALEFLKNLVRFGR